MRSSSILAELREIRAIALAADTESHRRADEEAAKLSREDQGFVRQATYVGTRIGVLLAKHEHIASRIEALAYVLATRPARTGARR